MHIRDICIRDTDTPDTPGAMDIAAGTDIDTTGVADDMFDHTRVGGRRGDGHMAAGTVGTPTGTVKRTLHVVLR